MRRFILILVCVLASQPIFGLNVTVNVKGLKSQLKDNVLAYLSIEQEKTHKSLNEARLHFLNDKAEEEIRKALQPFGYFKPVINGVLQKTKRGFVATYDIQSGPPIRIKEIDFQVNGEGRSDPRIIADFPIKLESVLDQSLYEAAKQNLLADTIEFGYLDARYTEHRVEVNLKTYSAALKLYLDTGMRFRFGKVYFNQDVMDPEFLARYVTFKAGDPFNQDALFNLQSHLIDSEYFKRVEVASRRGEVKGDRVPIDINLVPNKRNRYRIGLGYATDTGPRLTLDWRDRRIGRKGHHMSSKLQISKPISSLSSEYTVPLARPAADYISFGTSLEHFNSDTNQGDRVLLKATHSVSLERGWRRSLALEYSYEDFKVGDQEDIAHLLVPSATWLRIKSDGKERILKGKRLSFHIEGTSNTILSSTRYLQLTTNGKFIQGLGDGEWRLLSRAELGATWSDDLLELPPSKRFFSGGDNTVRGFKYQVLGPVDDSDEVIGGRYLAVGSLELDRHISGKWSGALFVDVGNAYDPDYDSETAYGVGFGVRWRSPVGPIRGDIASGTDGDNRSWMLHVVVGPEL
ncbi:MAG: autotransporter assembly complex protein TamA [Candidatus Thiodiazotropha sp.]